jgi:hypothetical protein
MNDAQNSIFLKLDERAAQDRARNERLQRYLAGALYLMVAVAGLGLGLHDLGQAQSSGRTSIFALGVPAADLVVAASMFALAGMILLGSQRFRSNWIPVFTTALFFAQAMRGAVRGNWNDHRFWSDHVWDVFVGLFGLLLVAHIARSLLATRKRDAAAPH